MCPSGYPHVQSVVLVCVGQQLDAVGDDAEERRGDALDAEHEVSCGTLDGATLPGPQAEEFESPLFLLLQ